MKIFGSVALAYLLASAVLWGIFGWMVRVARRLGLDPHLARCLGVIGVGLVGHAAFCVYWLSSTLGLVCSVLVCLGAVASLSARYRFDHDGDTNLAFGLTLLFGLFYLSGLFLLVPEKVPGLTNLVFFESVRPGDNNAPMAFAHAVYKRAATGLGLEWQLSERPPLQAGFELFFTPLRALFGNDDAHQAVGTLLQTSVIAALWLLGVALRLEKKPLVLSVLAIAGSGFVFYNSVYAWPKLLAATFFLIVLVPLGRAYLDDRRLTPAETFVVGAGAALAMLSHGGIAFSLLALAILLAVTVTKLFTLRGLALAAVTAAAVYAPWAGYTHFIDPNTNRLLKMHLTDGDSLSAEPFGAMFIRAYRDITLARWAGNRLANLEIMLGSATVDRIAFETAAGTIDPARPRDRVLDTVTPALDATKLSGDFRSLVSVIRADQREHVFRAFGLLNVAWLTLLLLVRRRWRDKLLDKALLGLCALNVLTVLVWNVLEFNPGGTVTTHASYAMIIIGMLIAVLLLYRAAPALACWACCANIALSFVIWVLLLPGPALSSPSAINWLALATAMLAAAAIVRLTARERKTWRFAPS